MKLLTFTAFALLLTTGLAAHANDGGIAILKAHSITAQGASFGGTGKGKDASIIEFSGSEVQKLMKVLPSESGVPLEGKVIVISKDPKTGKQNRTVLTKAAASNFVQSASKSLAVETAPGKNAKSVLISCQSAEYKDFTDQGDIVYETITPKCSITLYDDLMETDAIDFNPSKVEACVSNRSR